MPRLEVADVLAERSIGPWTIALVELLDSRSAVVMNRSEPPRRGLAVEFQHGQRDEAIALFGTVDPDSYRDLPAGQYGGAET